MNKNCLIIKAHNHSDWDVCNFVLVNFSESNKTFFSKCIKTAKALMFNQSFSEILFDFNDFDFYRFSSKSNDIQNIFNQNYFFILELSLEEITEFKFIEANLIKYQISISRDGFRFIAKDKNDNALFFSEHIPLNFLK